MNDPWDPSRVTICPYCPWSLPARYTHRRTRHIHQEHPHEDERYWRAHLVYADGTLTCKTYP